MAIPSEWAGPPVEWAGPPVSPTLPYLRVSKVCLMRPGVLHMPRCPGVLHMPRCPVGINQTCRPQSHYAKCD